MDLNALQSSILHIINWILNALLLVFNLFGKVINWMLGLLGRIF
jgi:hypothetical protein